MLMEIVRDLVVAFNYFVLVYFIALNGIYLFLTFISFFAVRRYMREALFLGDTRRLFRTSFYKPISVLAPAYNEEATIADSTRSLLQLRYPEYEILVINDGSTDRTLEVLIREFALKRTHRFYRTPLVSQPIRGVYTSDEHPSLVVIDKENGRKADALNAGINAARFPLVAVIDADSILESDVMLKLVQPYMLNPDTVAVGGIVRVVNGCTVRAGEVVNVALSPTCLPNLQIVEYLRAFLFGRIGWNQLNGLLVISGAFGLFKKSAVIAAGGYRHDTVGEDMELVVRLHRLMRERKQPYAVSFVPEPVCWTEVPETLAMLSRQRNRWQRGLMETLWAHKKMMLNPRYGIIGMAALPFFALFEMFGPVIEFVGYLVFAFSLWQGLVNPGFAVLFFLVAIVLGVVLSVSSLVLEELSFRKYPDIRHVVRLFGYAILENFWYRQLHSWWRLMGIVDYFRGKKSWGAMQRTGVKKDAGGTNGPGGAVTPR